MKSVPQKLPRIRILLPYQIFRQAFKDDFTAVVAAFRADVYYPVGALYYIYVVFDDGICVAFFQNIEYSE